MVSELINPSVSGRSSEVVKDEFSTLKLFVGLQIITELAIVMLLTSNGILKNSMRNGGSVREN